MLSGDVDKFGARMIAVSRAIDSGQREAVSAAALVVKKAIERQRDRDTGGDGKLSGVGKAGAKLGVRFTVKGGRSPSALVRATGPWPLIESDTSGRVIRSKFAGGRQRRGFVGPQAPGQFGGGGRRAVINIPGIGYRRSARHPGTKGKQTFAKGRQAGIRPAVALLGKNATNIIRSAIR